MDFHNPNMKGPDMGQGIGGLLQMIMQMMMMKKMMGEQGGQGEDPMSAIADPGAGINSPQGLMGQQGPPMGGMGQPQMPPPQGMPGGMNPQDLMNQAPGQFPPQPGMMPQG